MLAKKTRALYVSRYGRFGRTRFLSPAFPAGHGSAAGRTAFLPAVFARSTCCSACWSSALPKPERKGTFRLPPPAPSLSLELEQLDLSGLPGLPPLPAEDEVLPAAATQALPLPDEAPAADAGAEADAALPEAPRWNALEEGLEYAEFSLQSEAGSRPL